MSHSSATRRHCEKCIGRDEARRPSRCWHADPRCAPCETYKQWVAVPPPFKAWPVPVTVEE